MSKRLRDQLAQALRESGLPSIDDCEDDPPISPQLRNFIELWSSDPSQPVNDTWRFATVLTAIDEFEPTRRNA